MMDPVGEKYQISSADNQVIFIGNPDTTNNIIKDICVEFPVLKDDLCFIFHIVLLEKQGS